MHPHPDSAVNILPPVVHTITTYTYTHTWEVHEVHILPVVILLLTEKRCPIFPSYSYYFPLLTNNQYMRHLRYANIQLLTKIFLLGSASFNDSCLKSILTLDGCKVSIIQCQLSAHLLSPWHSASAPSLLSIYLSLLSDVLIDSCFLKWFITHCCP